MKSPNTATAGMAATWEMIWAALAAFLPSTGVAMARCRAGGPVTILRGSRGSHLRMRPRLNSPAPSPSNAARYRRAPRRCRKP